MIDIDREMLYKSDWSKSVNSEKNHVIYLAQKAYILNEISLQLFTDSGCYMLGIRANNLQKVKQALQRHHLSWLEPLIQKTESAEDVMYFSFKKTSLNTIMERLWDVIAELEPQSILMMEEKTQKPLRKDFEETFGLKPLNQSNQEKLPSSKNEPVNPPPKDNKQCFIM